MMEGETDASQIEQARGKKRRTSPASTRTSDRVPKKVSKFKTEDSWTVTEKQKLLDGLKRYNCHNLASLSKMVGSKTEKEVEEKIQTLRGSKSTHAANRVEGQGSTKAPIEAWIDLVQEMTYFETSDYSKCLAKILRLITQNETFTDPQVPRLKWRNIYQFLTDLAEDKTETHPLSDMECLVLLDMMHSLGDTLHSSDTSQQRHVLDLKYQLLNFKPEPEKEVNIYRYAQALSNDFWDVDDAPGKSGVSSTRLTPLQPQVLGDGQEVLERPLNKSVSELDISMGEKNTANEMLTHLANQVSASSSSLMSKSSSSQMSASTSNQMLALSSNQMRTYSVGIGPPSQSNQVDVCVESSDSGKEDKFVTKKPTADQSLRLRPNSTTTKGISSSGHPTTSGSTPVSCGGDGDKDPSQITLLHSHRFGKKFFRPKYFTLNPLCVPTDLLNLKAKE